MNMKIIETNGITYIEPVYGATSEWYFGMDYEHGDLYEAEELFNEGNNVKGRKLCLVHYPDGESKNCGIRLKQSDMAFLDVLREIL